MGEMDALVRWTWAFDTLLQVVLLVVLIGKGNFRRIPTFTAYTAANLCQAIVLYLAYNRLGFSSPIAAILAWSFQACTMILRVAATTESLGLVLKPYRGIWGLGWRVLTVAFVAVFSFALIDSRRNLAWAIILLDRGFHLALAIALVACLLLTHYYSIPIHPAYKALLGGFCFYSCMVVLANTLGGDLFVKGNADFQAIWQLSTMLSFAVVLLVWVVALRKPVPEPGQKLVSPSARAPYWELSPQINDRLRLLNEQLNHLWKPEVTRH